MTPFESAFIAGDGFRAELKIRDWARPVETHVRPDDHHLHLNLPPILYRGEIRFPELLQSEGFRVGRSFFRPANVLIDSTGTGGRAYSLDCGITRARMRGLIGEPPAWTQERLSQICDLDASPVFAILARIAEELRLPALAHPAMVECLMTQALVELFRGLERTRPDDIASGRLSAAQLDRIEQRLAAEELAPPTVAELARICVVSERHLLRLFHATMGRGVSQYIRERLLERARRMLSEGRPIKQVAFTLGFSGPNSFAIAFRKHTGTTPAHWRASSTGAA